MAARLSPSASPLEVVASMDPGADYSPYLLVTWAGVYDLVRRGSVSATGGQREAVVAALQAGCADSTTTK